MTRLPQTTSRELVRFLKSQGFVEDRQRGSHLMLRHYERDLRVAVPMHASKDLSRGLAADILKEAGYSVEDYIRLR